MIRTANLRLLAVSLMLLGACLFAPPAQAITIDYALMADTSPGEGGYDPLIVDDPSGIRVTATSPSGPGGSDYPYLDETWIWGPGGSRGGPGGLGVCQFLTGMNAGLCTPSDDDNLTFNGHAEDLILTFTDIATAALVNVTITEILIRNGLHEEVFLAATGLPYQFTINAVDYDLVHSFNTPLTGSQFAFSLPLQENDDNARMYIQAITFEQVPEPATLALLGAGLAGLGFSRRRKSA